MFTRLDCSNQPGDIVGFAHGSYHLHNLLESGIDYEIWEVLDANNELDVLTLPTGQSLSDVTGVQCGCHA